MRKGVNITQSGMYSTCKGPHGGAKCLGNMGICIRIKYNGAQHKQKAFAGLVCSNMYILCWHGVIGRVGVTMVGLTSNLTLFELCELDQVAFPGFYDEPQKEFGS